MNNKFANGKYEVVNKDKYVGKQLPTYRSSWEKKFCEMCDHHPNVLLWASEPISIKYFNPIKRKQSSYVPDFFIVSTDASGKTNSELVEIKPLSQTSPRFAKSDYDREQLAINAYKWQAAIKYCKAKGIKFKIITEQSILKNTKNSKNVKTVGRRKK